MDRDSAPALSFGTRLGVYLAGAGFVGLVAGLLVFTAQASWKDPTVLTFLVLGGALLATGTLLNARVASAFAVAVGLFCIALPFVQKDVKLPSTGGIILAAVGLALVVQGIVFNRRGLVELLSSRRGLAGVNVAISALLVLFLAVVVNLISVRHYSRIDLTGTSIFTLSSKTKQVLDGLKSKVRIVSLLHPGNEYYPQFRELLQEYELYSKGKLKVEYLFPTSEEDMKAIEKLKADLKEPPRLQTLIVIYGEGEAKREKHVRSNDLLEYPPYTGMMRDPSPPKLKGEEALTAAIIAVTEGKEQTVYFTAGHGELDPDNADEREGISRVVDDVKRDNYVVKKLELAAKKTIPTDCAALVVAGPKTKFSPLEVDLISDYLEQKKGKLLVMLDPVLKGREKSGLEPLLEKWGIKARTDVAVAGPQRFLGQVVGFDIQFATISYPGASSGNPIVNPIVNQNTVFTLACPMEATTESMGELKALAKVDVLVESDKDAWGETKLDSDEWKPDESDVKGPLPLVVSATQKDPNQPPPNPYGPPPPPGDFRGARIVAFGDSDLIVNRTASATNETIFVSSINWLTEQENKLGILPKQLQVGRIDYNESQGRIIFYLSILGLPGLALVAGCVVYLIRRS